MNEYRYAEIAIDGIHNRNKIIEIDNFTLEGIRTDCHRSIFLFNDDLKYFVEKTQSVSGFKGKHIADDLLFDFDGQDLDTVKTEIAKFIWHLKDDYGVPMQYMRLFFSGSKGFHLTIPFKAVCANPQPTENFYQVYKAIAQDLFDGFQFVDSAIYEMKHLFRMPNTINSKSNLFKIPLELAELDETTITIKHLAKTKRDLIPQEEIKQVPALKMLYDKWSNYNFNEIRPAQHSNEGTSILNSAPQGMRNATAIKLAGFYIDKGFSEGLTLEHLQLWNERNEPPLPEKELEILCSSAFTRYSKPIDFEVYSLKDAFERYKTFAKQSELLKIKTGYESIDKKLRGITPGETCCILGKTSVGKSAFLQNIGMNYAKETKQMCLFFSLEMPITSVIERAIQIENDLTGYDVENMTRKNEMTDKANLLFSNIPNFYTVEKSGLTLEAVKSFIKFAENSIYHKKTGLILLDYLGLVSSTGSDIYQQVSKVARAIKDLAKEMNVPIIYLTQVNNRYSEFDELDSRAARDSGSIIEAADFVLGLWKEKDQADNTDTIFESSDINLILGIIKNRKGGLGKVNIKMSKRSLKITER